MSYGAPPHCRRFDKREPRHVLPNWCSSLDETTNGTFTMSPKSWPARKGWSTARALETMMEMDGSTFVLVGWRSDITICRPVEQRRYDGRSAQNFCRFGACRCVWSTWADRRRRHALSPKVGRRLRRRERKGRCARPAEVLRLYRRLRTR